MGKIAVRCPSCSTGLSIRKTGENQSVTCPKCKYKGAIGLFPEIEVKKLICPSCRVILSMDPQYRGTIVCPKCQHRGDSSDYPAVTQQNPPDDGSVPTDIKK
jgi:uncharacterized Zn finger protein (UPF0148 family)